MIKNRNYRPLIVFPSPMSSKRTYTFIAFPQEPLRDITAYENLMQALGVGIEIWGAREVRLTSPVTDFFMDLSQRPDLTKPIDPVLQHGFKHCFEFSCRDFGTGFAEDTLKATRPLRGSALVVSPEKKKPTQILTKDLV